MGDISKLNGPVVQEVSLLTGQDDSEQKDSEPPARGGTHVNMPSAPKYEGNTAENEQKPYRWGKFILKYLPLVFAFSALFISISSKDASWESAGNSKRSADAAEQSATAAQRNAEIAEQALTAAVERDRRDQRAWVEVLRPFAPELKVGGETSFRVTLVNSGKTPARKVRSYFVALPVRTGESLTKIISYPPFPPQTSVTILSPQIPTTIYAPTVTRTFVETEVEDIKNKRVTVYLFGKVSYEDISGQAHCRTFCYWLSPDLNLGNSCETYNEETDALCPD